MALNPLRFTEQVATDFLRHQFTSNAFSDPDLAEQMRRLLSLRDTRRTPLLRGPYVSLSRAFRLGASVSDMVREGLLHPHLERIAPYPQLYGHQERAIRSIAAGRNTLVSTGTGSGKTESFLLPIVSRCLELRDAHAAPGVVAVIVYPMNALAEDQLGRLRRMLTGTGIPFGLYVGRTPERRADVTGRRLHPGASAADYDAAFEEARQRGLTHAIHPVEERPSREEMRAAGGTPRILLTNVPQMELLLTRAKDVELFRGASLEYLVFDEAHTFSGARGAETACLVRRLRAYCGRGKRDTVCIGTSATLADPVGGLDSARAFASRFFGVDAASVDLISEEYREEDWPREALEPKAPAGEPAETLGAALAAAEVGDANDSPAPVNAALAALGADPLSEGEWRARLFEALRSNAMVQRLVRGLTKPRALPDLVEWLTGETGRPVSDEEAIAWLVLGAEARDGDRPLLRPVVHAFVKGIGGAVVTFPHGQTRPRLWLAAEDREGYADEAGLVQLGTITCNTCGQHYFLHHVEDMNFDGSGPTGGQAVGQGRFWRPLDETLGGVRVVLVDRLISEEEDDDESPKVKASAVYLCRWCGALHPSANVRCSGCGHEDELVALRVAWQVSERRGSLSRCLTCQSSGRMVMGRYREPARPVRAVPVADVHVLAQSMIHRAERRRLLVFADSRQEAAFQAGWMRDHARRFRLRSLLTEVLPAEGASVGDLVAWMANLLDADDELSRGLIPEVWDVQRKERAGIEHSRLRSQYLRFFVLRELVTTARQRIGLEPWGRIQVEYVGLETSAPFVTEWAAKLGVEPQAMLDGVLTILDHERRAGRLLDRGTNMFTRFWNDGDFEIQAGFLPLMEGVPQGVTLERAPNDERNRISAWLTSRRSTWACAAARRMGVHADDVESFLSGLWRWLTDEAGLIVAVQLLGAKGGHVAGATSAHQLDVDRMRILPARGRWRCQRCRAAQTRSTPGARCLQWRCDGTLRFEEGDKDDFDLHLLDERFAMLRAAEHSAQVPAEQRDRLERWFKGDGEQVNTLVCTPTLEMGVDIGGLDTVLMRNVPPLPTNYWQRAGRAGRRHRLAVNVTYARPVSHDRAYFKDPDRMLSGRVEPPRFNLRNEVMVRRHVHAAAITRLHHLGRVEGGLPEGERQKVAEALDLALPDRVKTFLYDEQGQLRVALYDLAAFDQLVRAHLDELVRAATDTFAATWPTADADVVAEARLRLILQEMPRELEEVVRRLSRRVAWATNQLNRLAAEQRRRGTLEPDEESLRGRCEDLLKRLKGQQSRSRHEQEGVDDTTTYGVLAAEGFLPGYGLDRGSVVATALPPRHTGQMPFDLSRPVAMAVREYVPGNLVYANGGRYAPRFFHLDAEARVVAHEVDLEHGAVREIGSGSGAGAMGTQVIKSVPACDVDMPHASRIHDEEDYRFQMPVVVLGHESGRHGGGKAFHWGGADVAFRTNVHLRLVNVGPVARARQGELGYPFSPVDGSSRSPMSSERELKEYSERLVERTGQPLVWHGFHADVVADALGIQGLEDSKIAYSVLEALRIGMAHVLEMEREDVEVLVLGRMGDPACDGLLFDPMPGGSGLLQQAIERWDDVVTAALQVVEHCPSNCDRGCVDCLHTFRNAFHHAHLDRHVAMDWLHTHGLSLELAHEVPARMPDAAPHGQAQPTNEPEMRLREMLNRAGFQEGRWQHRIALGRPGDAASIDVFFPHADGAFGVCVFLDGLSRGIHGNQAAEVRDHSVRDELQNMGYDVIAIAKTHLDEREQMARHFQRLARLLSDTQAANRVRNESDWFAGDEGAK